MFSYTVYPVSPVNMHSVRLSIAHEPVKLRESASGLGLPGHTEECSNWSAEASLSLLLGRQFSPISTSQRVFGDSKRCLMYKKQVNLRLLT